MAFQFVELCSPAIARCIAKRKFSEPELKHETDGLAVVEDKLNPDRAAHSQEIYNQYTKPKFGDVSIGGCYTDFNEMVRSRLYSLYPKRCVLIDLPWVQVIQFGFMSLFAVAFPAAGFFAMVNNLQEIRSDAHKIVNQHQRPPVGQREDIGAWASVLSTVSYLAVITNAIILGFTAKVIYDSQFEGGVDDIAGRYGRHSFLLACFVCAVAHFAVLLRRYEKYELWMAVVAIEHAVLAIKSLVGSIAQEEPHKVTVAKRDQAAAEADLRLEKEALRRRQDAGHYENGASGVSQSPSSWEAGSVLLSHALRSQERFSWCPPPGGVAGRLTGRGPELNVF